MESNLKNNDEFIFINDTAIRRNSIQLFYWDEDDLELNMRLKTGDEHIFCFSNVNSLKRAVWEAGS